MDATPQQRELIVLAPAWPGESGGYAIAMQASLAAYLACFSTITFICVSNRPFENRQTWPSDRVKWIHVRSSKWPRWLRFVQSLTHNHPAILMPFVSAKADLMQAVRTAVRTSEGDAFLVLDDMVMGWLLPWLRKEFPQMPTALRSHNMAEKAFEPLRRVGTPFHRLAWHLEHARIRRFERKVCRQVDRVWAISQSDVVEYRKRLAVSPDGVVGVCLDTERYRHVPPGDSKTVIHVGSIDLRKGRGMAAFVETVWPQVLATIPGARLVLAGNGTQQFSNPDQGIEGLGFVQDDRSVLARGRLFVNPQQIGAGVQLKSIVAMLAGKVLVSTTMGAEGVAGKSGEHFVIADAPDTMAAEIVRLMSNEEQSLDLGNTAQLLASQVYDPRRYVDITKQQIEAFIHRSAGDEPATRRSVTAA